MDASTREHILDVAQELAQARGFHAFSYRDIAVKVGIRAPSIHYYFPSKDDLGVALIDRYRERFGRERALVVKAGSAKKRLERYAQLFKQTLLDGGKMCLCGMLAAEISSLPKPMQVGVQGFFAENEAWLAALLELGKVDQSLKAVTGGYARHAASVLATLEGALLAARVAKDPSKFDDTVAILVHSLAA